MKSLMISFALIFTVGISFAQEQPLIVVTFGNSTTAPRKTIRKVYAVRLHELLDNAGIANKVINAGIPGSHTGYQKDNNLFNIPHGRDRFDTAVIAHHPDWVTINFGINDSWQDKGKHGTSRIPLAEYRQNLTFFIKGIRNEGGKVILLTPNPIGEKYRGYHRRRLKKYRNVVIHLAEKDHVPMINTWKLFPAYVKRKHEKLDALLLDGVHPNDTGHKIVAAAIFAIMYPQLK